METRKTFNPHKVAAKQIDQLIKTYHKNMQIDKLIDKFYVVAIARRKFDLSNDAIVTAINRLLIAKLTCHVVDCCCL